MVRRHKTAKRAAVNKGRIAALVEEATVDCYNESEAVCGFYTMIEVHLAVPFATVVLGVDVEVAHFELTRQEEIVAVCVRGKHRQRIPVCDLPLPSPPPAGVEWIEAYRRWAAGE